MKKISLVFLLLFTALFAIAQSDGKVSKKVKKAEAKQEQQKRNVKNAELKGRKRHESIQDKATRKRMKRHRKGPVHVDAYTRKPFFLKRWFKKREN